MEVSSLWRDDINGEGEEVNIGKKEDIEGLKDKEGDVLHGVVPIYCLFGN
jgi:hypothetical protein